MIPAYIFTILFAIVEARADARYIAIHATIDHTRGWIRRAVFTAGVLAMFYAMEWVDVYWTTLIACAFLFSIAFRATLNTLRGYPISYISASNFYDRLFLGLGPAGGEVAYFTEIGGVMIFSLLG